MHVPVMVDETLEYLNLSARTSLKPGMKIVDANLGEGGHTRRILEKIGPQGKVLGIDRDAAAIEKAKANLDQWSGQVTFVEDRFSNLSDIALANDFTEVDGVLFDLGLSSLQLEDSKRGFSFKGTESLDMRMGSSNGLTAAEILADSQEADLEKMFCDYGEERFARRIAREIVRGREETPIITTDDLTATILRAIPGRFQNRNIHPATKVYQALRIAVNDELGELEKALPQAITLLKKGGRLVVISFHSLEDRIAKQTFKHESKNCVCPPELPVCRCGHQAQLEILTKKPILPTEAEIKNNPRSRSAKLRSIKKII